MIKNFIFSLLLLPLLLIMGTTDLSGQNLYTVLADSEDHDLFMDLLEYTELDSLLYNSDFYSVLAPTDEAFAFNYQPGQLDSLKVHDPDFLVALMLNHFVYDTIVADHISDYYLPLSGSHLILFVDAAANVSIKPFGAPTTQPYPRIRGSFQNDEYFTEYDNGRLFVLEQNVMQPNCRPASDWGFVIFGELLNVFVQSTWIDTLLNSDSPYTFLCPSSNALLDHIDQNGGLDNTTFVDSMMARHVIPGYLPLQEMGESHFAVNALGEELSFTYRNGKYYLNNTIEIRTFYDFKKSASYLFNDYIESPNTSSITDTESFNFEIYPNPASNNITLSHPEFHTKSRIKIYELNGKLIMDRSHNSTRYDLDISHLSAGLYLIEITNDNRSSIEKLLVY